MIPIFLASIPLEASLDVKITCNNYSLDMRDDADIKDGVNFIYQFFDQIYRFTDDQAIEIKLFGKYEDYFRYSRQITNLISGAGFYTPELKQIVMNGQRPKLEMLSILYHESTHAIFHKQVTENLPFWINEGIAEYFQTLEVTSDRRVTIRPQMPRHELLRAKQAAGLLPSLEDYLQFSQREWFIRGNFGDQEARSMGWSLVYFLMSEREGLWVLEDFLKALKTTADSATEMIRVLEQSYRHPLKNLEADWHEFLMSDPPDHSYPLPTRQIAIQQE